MLKFSISERVMKVVTYVSLLLLVIMYLASYISPRYSGIFTLVALVSPIIIFVNLALATYWVSKWKSIALLPIILIILGLGQITLLIQIPITKEEASKYSLRVMTFNTHFLNDENHRNVTKRTLDYISDSINVDIICFQEMCTGRQDRLEVINKTLAKYKYSYIYEHKVGKPEQILYSAIYSKYPIVNKEDITIDSHSMVSMYADIIYRRDTIRVFNNHLQSNNIANNDLHFLLGEDISDNMNRDIFRLFTIFKKLNKNGKLRAMQAETIAKVIKETPYPTIVCCDLNSPPTSYTYRKIRGDMKDSFVERGEWYGYTYKNLGRLLRIDYIFYSDQFRAVDYRSPNMLWSDHKPVIVDLKYR